MTASPRSLGLHCVLVADDEHLVAAGLASCLTSLGCGIVGPAADGNAAIALAKEHAPDLALLDIRMPGRDGIEVAQSLWNDLHIPCVIVSAYSDDDYLQRAQDTGIFGYLLKPVTIDSLRATLAIAWSRSQADQNLRSRVSQLENSLANRKIIERAKWKLVETRGMSESEAHSHLQRTSRNTRRTIVEVACEIMDETTPANN